jgi:hypothetical protein
MQCHHIVPHSNGGEDTFDNCIPLCLECHGEVMAYNPKHPIGTQYSPRELKRRRDEWYEALKNPRVTVLGPAHAKIVREMVKRRRNVCSERRTMQIFFYETNYALGSRGVDEEVPHVLLRLYYGSWKQVDCHFLDPSLESLFAEFNARVLVMIQALNQIRGSKLWYSERGVSLDEQEYQTFRQCASQANNAANDLYKSYGELIHECRLRLEINTLDEL